MDNDTLITHLILGTFTEEILQGYATHKLHALMFKYQKTLEDFKVFVMCFTDDGKITKMIVSSSMYQIEIYDDHIAIGWATQ